jgi:membrane protein
MTQNQSAPRKESSKAVASGEAEIPAPVAWALEKTAQKMPTLHTGIYFLWRLIMRWGEDQCPLKAAAMAFFGLISIFPIVLAAVSVLATILSGDVAALTAFQNFVKEFFPAQTGQNVSAAMKNAVDTIAAGSNAMTLGVVALGSLLWSGRAFFATLAEVLNSVWPDTQERTFLQNQIVLWGTFAGAGVLWMLSMASTFLVTVLGWLLQYLPEFFRDALPWIAIASRGMSFFLSIVMFWLMYRFLPHVTDKHRRRLVWAAALVAALGWEIAKIAFAQFLGNLDRYQATYGSVAGVVLTMMWIYFSSVVILLGAEAVAAYEETRAALSRDDATHSN